MHARATCPSRLALPQTLHPCPMPLPPPRSPHPAPIIFALTAVPLAHEDPFLREGFGVENPALASLCLRPRLHCPCCVLCAQPNGRQLRRGPSVSGADVRTRGRHAA